VPLDTVARVMFRAKSTYHSLSHLYVPHRERLSVHLTVVLTFFLLVLRFWHGLRFLEFGMAEVGMALRIPALFSVLA
jgi:hypothetical protein